MTVVTISCTREGHLAGTIRRRNGVYAESRSECCRKCCRKWSFSLWLQQDKGGTVMPLTKKPLLCGTSIGERNIFAREEMGKTDVHLVKSSDPEIQQPTHNNNFPGNVAKGGVQNAALWAVGRDNVAVACSHRRLWLCWKSKNPWGTRRIC